MIQIIMGRIMDKVNDRQTNGQNFCRIDAYLL